MTERRVLALLAGLPDDLQLGVADLVACDLLEHSRATIGFKLPARVSGVNDLSAF